MTLPVPWNWPPVIASAAQAGAVFPFANVTDPDPWDLIPSKWTNPDLNLNNWFIYQLGGGAVQLTNNGVVDIRTDPPAGTYRASLVEDQLWIQLPRGVYAYIGRSGAASGETYKARIRSLMVGNGGSNTYLAMLYAATGLILETGGVDYVRIGQVDIHQQQHWFTGGGFHPTNPNGDTDFNPAISDSDAVYYLDVPPFAGSQGVESRGVSSYSGAWCYYSPAGSNVALGGPITHVGAIIGNNGNARPNLFYINYIARQDLYQFP